MKKIKMAIRLKDDYILFHQQDERGLFLGDKEHYKTLGEYTGELKKICDNEESYMFYLLCDILQNADDPDFQSRLKLAYYILNMPAEAIKQITSRIERWED